KTRWGKFQDSITKFGKAAAAALAGPIAVMGALSAAAAGAGTALWKMTRAGADIVDPLAKLSDSLSIGTGELMGLVHGADLAGASAEDLQKGLERMLRSINDNNRGIAAIGLDAMALKAMGTAKAFETISDRLAAIENPAQRVGAAL